MAPRFPKSVSSNVMSYLCIGFQGIQDLKFFSLFFFQSHITYDKSLHYVCLVFLYCYMVVLYDETCCVRFLKILTVSYDSLIVQPLLYLALLLYSERSAIKTTSRNAIIWSL